VFVESIEAQAEEDALAVSWYRKAAQLGNDFAKEAFTRLGR